VRTSPRMCLASKAPASAPNASSHTAVSAVGASRGAEASFFFEPVTTLGFLVDAMSRKGRPSPHLTSVETFPDQPSVVFPRTPAHTLWRPQRIPSDPMRPTTHNPRRMCARTGPSRSGYVGIRRAAPRQRPRKLPPTYSRLRGSHLGAKSRPAAI
jgi:hypothetical protein